MQQYSCRTCKREYQYYYEPGVAQGLIKPLPVCNCPTPLIKTSPGSKSVKNDSSKPDLSILSFAALSGIAQALEFGARKYSRYNYLDGGFEYTRLSSAALRHLYAWIWGEDKDSESGLSHLYHLGACVIMLIDQVHHGIGTDNRFKPKTEPTTHELKEETENV